MTRYGLPDDEAKAVATVSRRLQTLNYIDMRSAGPGTTEHSESAEAYEYLARIALGLIEVSGDGYQGVCT